MNLPFISLNTKLFRAHRSMEPLCRFRATPFATTLAPPNHRGLVLRRGLAPAPRGWRDDSPLDDGSGGVANVKNKNNKKNKLKKLKVGSKGKGSAEDATLKKIDLGQGKSVLLYTPNDVAELDVAADRINYETLESFRDELYGAGDVVWPASTALARLVAHCPSLVRGKRVLEVGAGLGLVGNVAAQAGAAEVLMVDYDPEVLELAAKSAAANQASHSTPVKVSTARGRGQGRGSGAWTPLFTHPSITATRQTTHFFFIFPSRRHCTRSTLCALNREDTPRAHQFPTVPYIRVSA